MMLTFGKYQGRLLSDVPENYLHWYVESQQKLLRQFLDEIERREALESAKMSWAERIIQTGYRSLTLKHHPDRGGDNGTMREINGSREALLQLLKNSGLN